MNGLFNVNGGELVVILLVLALVVGPDRLPQYAEQLARFVRGARDYARKAKERVDEEVGEGLGEVDWSSLDPRQYDPRRIVRDALLDPEPAPLPGRAGAAAATAAAAAGAPRGLRPPAAGVVSGPRPDVTPFDDEAT